MAYIKCKGRNFRAYITVQTNPNVYVGATLAGKTYAGTANANGVVTIEVRKKGTYTVSNSNGTSTTVAVILYKRTYNCDIVTVGTPTCNVATWSSATACAYWTWGNYHSGMLVYRDGSQIYNGNGSSLQLSSSQTVTGITNGSLRVGQTYAYKFKQYYTVNGRTFYSAERTVNYTAVNCSVSETTFSSTTNWTCPTGIRTLQVFLVGGGGGGGNPGSNPGYESSTGDGGGGGGGRTAKASINVIPGTVYTVTVGAGGSIGGNGGTSKFGNLASALGGNAGAQGSQWWYGGAGGNGGSGGGGGTTNHQGDWSYGGYGGSDGSDGGEPTTYSGYTGGAAGIGQRTTTRKWHTSGATLYSGGGGGTYKPGGSGGGGQGAYARSDPAVSGTANSGGGGGGGGVGYAALPGASGGSGLVIIKS